METAEKPRPPKLPPRKASNQVGNSKSTITTRKTSNAGNCNSTARAPKLGPRKLSSQIPLDRNATPTPPKLGMNRRTSESRDATPTPQKRRTYSIQRESAAPKLGPRKSASQSQSLGKDDPNSAPKHPTEKSQTHKPQAERRQGQKPPIQKPQSSNTQGAGTTSKPTPLSGVRKLGPRNDAAAQSDKEQPKDKSKFETSLTTILDARQRTQLVILLAAATASMRDNVSHCFDATAASSQSLWKSSSMTENEKIMNPDIDPGTADVGALDKERKAVAKREKEVSAEKMKELKAAAEDWFDTWRETVIGRVGEVLNSSKEAKGEIESKEADEMKPKTKTPNDKKIDSSNEGSVTDHGVNEDADAMIKEMYPAVRTQLADLDEEKRVMILHSVLLLMLSTEHYSSASRVLLLYLVSSLRLSLDTLKKDEEKTAHGLLESAKELSASDEAKRKALDNEKARKWKVGLASVAGAAIVGVTGGMMAAPLVAAGVSSVMGGLGLGATTAASYLGSVAGSSVVVGSLFGAYGGRMTGQMMDSYAKDVDDFGFIPVHAQKRHLLQGRDKGEKAEADAGKKDPSSRRLRVTIGISGWLTEKEEVVKPWSVLSQGSEAFALRWELEALMYLGNAMTELVQSAAWGYAQKQIVSQTIFAELSAAMWPLAMVKVARVIDNPFSVAKARAEKAGEVLADALINHAQGERPVNLVGYSLGARVIYSCLMNLAERKAFGLIENVVMIGAPVPATGAEWRRMRAMVGSRLVNVFSENDYILKFLYRTGSAQYRVAGLQTVVGVSGVENVDVSQSVSGHLRYRFMVGKILRILGFEDLDMKEVEKEEAALEKMDEEERQRVEELKSKIPGQSSNNENEDENEMSEADAEKEANQMKQNVERKTQRSMMQRGAELLHLRNYSRGQMAKDMQDVTAQDLGEKAKAGGQVASSYLSYMKSKMPSRETQDGTEEPAKERKGARGVKRGTGATGKSAEKTVDNKPEDGKAQSSEVHEDKQSYMSMATERFHVIRSAAGKKLGREQDHPENDSISGKTETTTTAEPNSDVTPESPSFSAQDEDPMQTFEHVDTTNSGDESAEDKTPDDISRDAQEHTQQDSEESEHDDVSERTQNKAEASSTHTKNQRD